MAKRGDDHAGRLQSLLSEKGELIERGNVRWRSHLS